MTYKELLALALEKVNFYDKEEEAVRFLLLEMSKLSNTDFYLQFETKAPEALIKEYLNAIDEYIVDNKPIQHILGYSYFYGRKFNINRHSFIPRAETEELVENILIAFDDYFKNIKNKVKVLDLGTGSGAIGITLALEEDSLDVYASEVSKDALKIAKKTANDLVSKVQFIESDWFTNISERFDIIVSNPPYIPNDEELDPIVKNDPKLALFGGEDGTIFYKKILKEISDYINDYGLIAFEHGFDQAAKITMYAKKYLNNPIVKTIKDMQGKDRITLIGLGGVLK